MRNKPEKRYQSQDRRQAPIFYDLELEAQIIGAILNENKIWKSVQNLDQDCFTDEIYKIIWDKICDQISKGRTASPSTIVSSISEVFDSEENPRAFLSSLASYAENIDFQAIPEFANRLIELKQWRKFQACRSEIDHVLNNPTGRIDKNIGHVISMLQQVICSGNDTSRTKHEIIQSIRESYIEPKDPISTGIESLDIIFHGGLVPGRSYGIGAPYGRGKTILMGSISDNLNRRKERHLIITAETPPEDIEVRNTARHMKLNASQITDGTDYKHDQFTNNIERYQEAIPDETIYEYTPGIDINGVLRIVRKHIYNNNIKGFMLDYVQVVGGKERGQSTLDHLNSVCNQINTLCRQEGIWCIIMAQAEEGTRQIELDQIKKPISIFVRMQRDPNEEGIIFITEKNNYGRLSVAGTENAPGAIFDTIGPHIRDMQGIDHARTKITE